MRSFKLLACTAALSLVASASSSSPGGNHQPDNESARTNATMCFAKGERVDGMNKICYYDCLGSDYAITIKAHQLCPLSIKR